MRYGQALRRRNVLWHDLFIASGDDGIQILGFNYKGRFGIFSWGQEQRVGNPVSCLRHNAQVAPLIKYIHLRDPLLSDDGLAAMGRESQMYDGRY